MRNSRFWLDVMQRGEYDKRMHFSNKMVLDVSPHDWLFWSDCAHGSAFNMAADQVLFDHAAVFNKPVLRLYDWERPTVSFGRSQRYPKEIPDGVEVVRRPTGGGVVQHGTDCTYTLVLPAEHALSALEISESYRFIHLSLLAQFPSSARLADTKTATDPLTMHCFDSPVRFDILDPDGMKCAGAAQLRRDGASLTQGSVRLSISGGGRESVQQAILDAFEHAAHARYVTWKPDANFLIEVNDRVSRQFATEGWNRNGTLPSKTGKAAR